MSEKPALTRRTFLQTAAAGAAGAALGGAGERPSPPSRRTI